MEFFFLGIVFFFVSFWKNLQKEKWLAKNTTESEIIITHTKGRRINGDVLLLTRDSKELRGKQTVNSLKR